MPSNSDMTAELTLMKDEIIALQIKVAALEMLTLTKSQKAEYEKILKEQTERIMQLRMPPRKGERTN